MAKTETELEAIREEVKRMEAETAHSGKLQNKRSTYHHHTPISDGVNLGFTNKTLPILKVRR